MDSSADTATQPAWKSIPSYQRRVLGVLVEKAKTTPSGYPLTLNAVKTGCNQKSNRHPVLNMDPEDVEDALDSLRSAGAVGEVHGDGRVAKYRHYMKQWMGVDGTELAVMAELLLRGTQSVGELRGRAARMANNQLPDMASLAPILRSLVQRKLVIEVTPEGRGQVVTHGLWSESELARIQRQYGATSDSATSGPTRKHPASTPSNEDAPSLESVSHATDSTTTPAGAEEDQPTAAAGDVTTKQLASEVQQLRREVAELRQEIENLWENIG